MKISWQASLTYRALVKTKSKKRQLVLVKVIDLDGGTDVMALEADPSDLATGKVPAHSHHQICSGVSERKANSLSAEFIKKWKASPDYEACACEEIGV